MTTEVKVTGKGQTIPSAKATADLGGSGSPNATSREMKLLLDKLRNEDRSI